MNGFYIRSLHLAMIPKKKWIKDFYTLGIFLLEKVSEMDLSFTCLFFFSFPGEKGFPALPSNSSSALLLSSPNQNGYSYNQHPVIQNGMHYASSSSSSSTASLPYQKSHTSNGSSIPRVPEPANGYKLSDHSYRRGHLSQSPTYEFNGGTNRASKG